jgi:DNA-binding transcriptional ArsR family regulator
MSAHTSQVNAGVRSDSDQHSDSDTASAAELLALFGDEYACDILRTLADGPASARALADACGMSRPTAYRRLNRLTDAGLVEERLQIAPDGHHRKEFRLVGETATFELVRTGITSTIDTDRSARD